MCAHIHTQYNIDTFFFFFFFYYKPYTKLETEYSDELNW